MRIIYEKMVHLHRIVSQSPPCRPLLITDKRLEKPISLIKDLFPKCIVYDGVTSEPCVNVIAKMRPFLTSHVKDVIALGGGSVMDAAKLLIACDENDDFAERKDRPRLIAIPTTAGTGSEVTPFAVVSTSSGEKRLIKGEHLVPDVAWLDSSLTHDKPSLLTACTGMDALCHAMEAFVSRRRNDASDGHAMRAMMRIGRNLEASAHNPTAESRHQMLKASMEAGLAFSKSSVTLVHGMSRPLGRFGIGHGMANAMLVADVTRYSMSAPDASSRYAIAKAVLFPESNEYEDLPFLLDDMVHGKLKIPRLKDALSFDDKEMYHDRIGTMVREALDSGSPSNNPIVPRDSDVREIYERLIL